MSPEEKQISFMNRYFAFKKVRSLDVKKMHEIILHKEEQTRTIVDNILEDTETTTETQPEPVKKTNTKKIKKDKIVLQKKVEK